LARNNNQGPVFSFALEYSRQGFSVSSALTIVAFVIITLAPAKNDVGPIFKRYSRLAGHGNLAWFFPSQRPKRFREFSCPGVDCLRHWQGAALGGIWMPNPESFL